MVEDWIAELEVGERKGDHDAKSCLYSGAFIFDQEPTHILISK